MKKLYSLLQMLLIFTTLQAHRGDVDSVMTYIRNAMNFNRAIPQEKVYLHLDNTGYFENETMWFKAYLVRTDSGKPSDLSKVLYVELLNMSGDVIKTTKWPVDSVGQSSGDMALDSLLGSGFYEVRAYTRYMTNWGTNACFSRVVPVFKKPEKEGYYGDLTIKTRLYKFRDPNNRDKSDALYAKTIEEGVYSNDLAKTISAQFYPEGGKMVVGKRSRVAVMVVDDNGNAYQQEGHVVNGAGDVLTTFRTDSLGRALLEIVPDGQPLFVQMHNKKGGAGRAVQTFVMPEASKEGCVLRVDAVSDDMVAEIQCSDSLCGKMLGCVLLNNGNVVYCDTMYAKPLVEIQLERSCQKAGVNQLTVFDACGRILAERMYFICPPKIDSNIVSFVAETDMPRPCGKVALDFQTLPHSTLSCSVVDAQNMTNGWHGNMNTWMLLSSEVRGCISNVDYYFESDDREHRMAADMLMLTQGWRRYDWELMDGARHFKNIQPIEDKFYVFGRLNVYRKKNPVANVGMEVFLYNASGESLAGKTMTDSLGNYAFEMPFVDGEWKMQIYTRLNNKRKTYYVGIDRQFSPKARYVSREATRMIPPLKPNLFVGGGPANGQSDEADFVPITMKNHLLQNVVVKSKRRYFTNDDWKYKNERWGSAYATLYYNIDRERDDMADRGQEVPDIFTFLCRKNVLFENTRQRSLTEVSADSFVMDFSGGLSYGGRPVKWIVDNGETMCVLHLGQANSDAGSKANEDDLNSVQKILGVPIEMASFVGDELPAGYSNKTGFLLAEHFPFRMDEIKSLYIVPNSPKEVHNAVRIYIYTHKKFTTESHKGLRRTYFQGFNRPSVFKMEDYSVVPPMADFRRTIYWNPCVRTDANGRAKVEFYNNSTCREMFVSVEGMSDDGKILVGK